MHSLTTSMYMTFSALHLITITFPAFRYSICKAPWDSVLREQIILYAEILSHFSHGV